MLNDQMTLSACCGGLNCPASIEACVEATVLSNLSASRVEVLGYNFNIVADALCVLRELRNSDKKLERMLPGI